MDLKIGDTIITKKNHPCGGNTWKILRIGMDFRIKCLTCERQLMISRNNLEKRIKKVLDLSENV